MNKKMRVAYAVVFALILAALTFAYAAANTVPVTYAGDGSSTTSGYTVSNVHYVLDTTNPANIAQVTFTLDAPATDVRIQLVTGGSWFTCSVSGGTNVTCNVSGVTVLAANTLRVVAVQ
ncbi:MULTISPECIES: hypothetical protein [Anaerolinea]|uniref:hypothetical protein n=1 Tax=Anaerolinea TaxID=233189 RepID=UPI00262E425A|nr:hypothetical protein [Anaerolinea thermophila]